MIQLLVPNHFLGVRVGSYHSYLSKILLLY